MKRMKKMTALLLAAAMLASCGTTEEKPAGTTTTPAQDEAETTPAAPAAASASLSNPVAVDATGDVDMEVALAYETDFDALLKSLDEKTVGEGETVSNQTNEKTQALYDWLRENYGKNIITAQQVSGKKQTEDLVYYLESEDLPAIKGFDFIFTTTNNDNPSEWTEMAIDWHTKSNGIVAFCWHWNVPIDVDQGIYTNAKAFYSKDIKNFSLKNAVTPGTKEYEVAIHDIDLIAIELQKLEAAGVPVLWRPLHEASGKWFWWGLADRETAEEQYYQKLWYMIYDRLENYHKLTNLIWVWNGQSKHTQVHPNTYDISGIDVYPDSEDHSAQEKKYSELNKITEEGKMLALSEVGYIPDPDEPATLNWLFFMPWNGEFIYKETDVFGIPKINTERMSSEFLKKVMTHENVITWSELPDWGGTERNLPESIQGNLFYINQAKADAGQ